MILFLGVIEMPRNTYFLKFKDWYDRNKDFRTGSIWIYTATMSAYYRITTRLLGGTWAQTIDIASVSVEEKNRRKGKFTRLLSSIEKLADSENRAIYIESVQTDEFADFFARRGYERINVNNFYRMPNGRNTSEKASTSAP